MKGFEPVSLSWGGATYEVPPSRQLMLVAEIEDALCGGRGGSAVQMLMRDGGPGTARLSMAYAAALRFAGAEVSGDEVYLSIMQGMAEHDPKVQVTIQNAILALLALVAPPIISALSEAMESGGEKKTQAAE